MTELRTFQPKFVPLFRVHPTASEKTSVNMFDYLRIMRQF